jgi:hypothetical protein
VKTTKTTKTITKSRDPLDLFADSDDEEEGDEEDADDTDSEEIIVKKKKKSTSEIDDIMFKVHKMFQTDKMNTKQIGKSLKIKSMKMDYYIERLYKGSHELDMNRLGFSEDTFNDIKGIVKDPNDPGKLADIKKNLPDHITYLHIKLGLIRMKKEEKALPKADKKVANKKVANKIPDKKIDNKVIDKTKTTKVSTKNKKSKIKIVD